MGLRRPHQASTIIGYVNDDNLPHPFRTIASLEKWADENLKVGDKLSYDQRGANPDAGRTVYTVT